MVAIKRCSKCGIEKSADEFQRRSNRPGGLRSQCKECVREPARLRAAKWLADNREEVNAARRQKRKDDPEAARERDRERYARRKDDPRYRAYQKQWRARNADALQQYHREWQAANPEKVRQYAENASPEARARAAEYIEQRKAEQHAVLDAFKRDTGCADCGTRDGVLDFDHRDGETKRWAVSKALGCSWDALWDEIAKCDVRCRPCHARRHVLAGDTLRAA